MQSGSGANTLTGATTVSNTLTVGSDGSGQDVVLYSATAGDNLTWDASAEALIVTGTNGQTALNVADGNLVVADNIDLATDIDVDGTANLDAVDIDGAVQVDATVTVGVDDTGYDVKFFGDAQGAYMLWDEDVDDLILTGAARLVVPEGQLVLGSTAVTTTPAEINLIDGGTARGTTAVASGDGILINDGGTMRMTNVDTVSTYFSSHNVGGGNIITTGALGSGSIATGFGAIDNGTSNVTTGGLLSLDTDADADDNTADSSSGRLTIGAGGDLNLYHGGTNSYIVNSTGSLYIHSETAVSYTHLTLPTKRIV